MHSLKIFGGTKKKKEKKKKVLYWWNVPCDSCDQLFKKQKKKSVDFVIKEEIREKIRIVWGGGFRGLKGNKEKIEGQMEFYRTPQPHVGHLRFRPELMLDSKLCNFCTTTFLFASFRSRYLAKAHAYWVALNISQIS